MTIISEVRIESEVMEWVENIAHLTDPREIVWIDGSRQQLARIQARLLAAGTVDVVAGFPNSFAATSDPADVARVEDRTFICTTKEADAGPTNNWAHPDIMKSTLRGHFRGSMRGRTLYVVPFCMGSLDAETPMLGVQVTDSEYVVASMAIMTRVGDGARALIQEGHPFVRGLHSVGAPLEPGQNDVPWPCNETKYISHFPETREIWSFGSGYGGNALLGKKCYSLRIASAIAREEGWLAEHMLIIKVTTPTGDIKYLAAAFPSACGKTNLAMLESSMPGYKVEMLGDDIAWLRPGPDGRLYAVNPEAGLFGVAPGTGWSTNPNAMKTLENGDVIFTNVARTEDHGVWWEGMGPRPERVIDWTGRVNHEGSGTPAAHPNSRFCVAIENCPTLAPEYHNAGGVPIDAILFGGRRSTAMPLVTQARSWRHGVFMGATISSETTAAATGAVGVVRRDPMAMLPFCGYDMGTYFSHWLSFDKPGAKLPAVFSVNWFRKEGGSFLWPGFGENMRVLKWIIERLDGEAQAESTFLGYTPTSDALDLADYGAGSIDPDATSRAVAARPDEWVDEVTGIAEWFAHLGDTVPSALHEELDALRWGVAQNKQQ